MLAGYPDCLAYGSEVLSEAISVDASPLRLTPGTPNDTIRIMTIVFANGVWRIQHEALKQAHIIPPISLTSDMVKYFYLTQVEEEVDTKKLPGDQRFAIESFLEDRKIWETPMVENFGATLNPPFGMAKETFLEIIKNVYSRVMIHQTSRSPITSTTHPDEVFHRTLVVQSWEDFLLYAEIGQLEAILICWLAANGFHPAAKFTKSEIYGAGMLSSISAIAQPIRYDVLARIGLPLTKTRQISSRKFWRACLNLRQIGLLETAVSQNRTLGRQPSYLALTRIGIEFAKDMTRELNNFTGSA